MYEQIRTITRLINLEARRKCLEVPGCLELGEKVTCTLHTPMCTCLGNLGRPWALAVLQEDVVGTHRGVCRLKGETKVWLQVELWHESCCVLLPG